MTDITHYTAGLGKARSGMAWRGKARRGRARRGGAWQGQQGEIPALYSNMIIMTNHTLGGAWQGMARQGGAGRGKAWQGKARAQGFKALCIIRKMGFT